MAPWGGLGEPREEVRQRLGALAEQRQQERLELPPVDLDRGRHERDGQLRVAIGVRPHPLGVGERARTIEVGELGSPASPRGSATR